MSSKIPCTLVWLRRDLRLIDNPALFHAAKRGQLITVYIFDEDCSGKRKAGQACLWWLYHSLKSLHNQLSQWNIPLIMKSGNDAFTILKELLDSYNADAIYWNRCYEPFEYNRDCSIEEKLKMENVTVETYQDRVLFEPWTIKTAKGGPVQIYVHFWNQCLSLPQPRKPYDKPKFKNQTGCQSKCDEPAVWQRLAKLSQDMPMKLQDFWHPGEEQAISKLKSFIKNSLNAYAEKSQCLRLNTTSNLSPYLHFGEISPFTVWHSVRHASSSAEPPAVKSESLKQYLRSLGWREYTCHLLFHYPDLPQKCFRSSFEQLKLQVDPVKLQSWQQGNTGYPVVDAGMRQLSVAGIMPNRLRMIVASFLIKHLLVPWQKGEEWFWSKLIDADLAQNAFNWQWAAGSGPNACPYFRVFNPITQGEKFDADGYYVRKWIPELAALPNAYIHKPWEAPSTVLKKANIVLGKTYPRPIVQHKAARELALATFGQTKRKQEPPTSNSNKRVKEE
ncbi:Deoxyribodipyrimidine photo-lyase [Trichoplax sp. H2]|nr:Deoxyribodipyrimidine photo-lyase [Trichoplax sp. H2]|eukprot:RDD41548.1 Deoxyribodipyrimidine photo-lyase [Trichoplax sp. H2]